MTPEKIAYFKQKLEQEKILLEEELTSVGRVNPANPKDWEAVPPEMDATGSEKEEVAEKFEAYEENTAILKQLEIKYNLVKKALEKIEAGTYGICEISGDPIEEDRLEANPAATTCKAHLNG